MPDPKQQTRMPDVEWLAVEHRVKPAMRVTLPAEKLAQYVERLQKKGFAHTRAERAAHLPGRDSQEVVYVAWTQAAADAVKDAESTILPGGPARTPDDSVLDAHRRLGAALGYPSCCVEAFLGRLQRGVTRRSKGGDANEDFVAAEDAHDRSGRFDARVNNLLFDRQLRFVSFYPCRYDCPTALAYADGVLGVIRRVDPAAADRMLDALACRIVIRPDGSRTAGDANTPPADALVMEFVRP